MNAMNYYSGLDLGVVMLILIITLGLLGVYCFYLYKLQQLLEEVEDKNRLLPATNVWLMLIPLFNLVYGFIMYPKICDSLRNEFEYRDAPQKNYMRNLGLALPIVRVSGILFGLLSTIGWLVLWIIFWTKMTEFKRLLESLPRGSGNGINLSNRTDLLD